MLEETQGMNMKPLRVWHWFGDKITEDVHTFKELLNEVHAADKAAAAARKVLENLTDAMPSPDEIRDALKAARDAELQSLYKQYEAARFYRQNLQEQLREAQITEVHRLQKIRKDIHEKITRDIVKLGEPNELQAAKEAAAKQPVREATQDIQPVENYHVPEYGDDNSLSLLEAEIRRVAETL